MFKISFKAIVNNKGTTLVEMIAAFGLLSLFLAFSAALLTSYFNVFANINNMIASRKVFNTIIKTIEGEIEAAMPVGLYGNSPEIFVSIIKEEGKPDSIIFTDKNNIKVKAAVDAGRLVFTYINSYEGEQNWFYGDEVYCGCKIDGLEFNLNDDEKPWLIEIKMRIKNGSNEYEGKRIICCKRLKDFKDFIEIYE